MHLTLITTPPTSLAILTYRGAALTASERLPILREAIAPRKILHVVDAEGIPEEFDLTDDRAWPEVAIYTRSTRSPVELSTVQGPVELSRAS